MKRLSAFAGLTLALLTGSVAQAELFPHPNIERGFAADKTYAVGDIDSVNVFNGNLTLRVPIGQEYHVGGNLSYQLGLSYNSKVWDFENYHSASIGGTEYFNLVESYPSRRSNSGVGWLLTMGQLIAPEDPTNQTEEWIVPAEDKSWVYVSPDGAEHELRPTLHPLDPVHPTNTPIACGGGGEALQVLGVEYATDSTY